MSNGLRLTALAVTLLILGAADCRRPKPVARDPRFAQAGTQLVALQSRDCRELTDFVFSPDGAKVIYTGLFADNRARPAGVWVGESLLARVDSVFEIGFAENGEPYFVACDSGRSFLYYRHAHPRSYDRVLRPTFSRDGSRIAYLTQSGMQQMLMIENASTQVVTGVLDFALSPNGDRFAYATRDSADWFVVEGADTSDIFDWVQDMTYTRDGKALVYTAMAEDEWFVVANDEEFDHYGDEVIEITGLTLSDDGAHIAYIVAEADTLDNPPYCFAVVDGYESETYLDISDLCFAPNAQAFSFVADDGDGPFVVNSGREDSLCDEIWGLTYSPDGVRLAYAANLRGEEFVVVEGVEHAGYDGVDKVKFAPDGRRVGYGARRDREFLWVVDDIR